LQSAVGTGFGAADAEFEGIVGGAGVTVGERRDAEKNLFRCGDGLLSETVFFVGECAVEKFGDLRSGERFEDVDLGAREQRRDDLEGRIFRGGANKIMWPAST